MEESQKLTEDEWLKEQRKRIVNDLTERATQDGIIKPGHQIVFALTIEKIPLVVFRRKKLDSKRLKATYKSNPLKPGDWENIASIFSEQPFFLRILNALKEHSITREVLEQRVQPEFALGRISYHKKKINTQLASDSRTADIRVRSINRKLGLYRVA